MSPSHAPINPPIVNLDPEHIYLNVPIVNSIEGDVFAKKAAYEVEIVNLELSLTLYDSFFQDIPVEEDVGETGLEKEAPLEEEVQLEKEAPMEKEFDLCNVIVEPMNTTFNKVVLENVVMKDQIANLNTQVQGLEAIVSTVTQLSSALAHLTSLMKAHNNRSSQIVKWHDRQFIA